MEFFAWMDACSSTHDAPPLRGPRYARIEPAIAIVRERAGFIEQHHVIPLRALCLVDRQHVAKIELVGSFALLPVEFLDGAGKAFRSNRYLDQPLSEVLIGLEPHPDDLPARLRTFLHYPEAAVEQSLAPVVAQADQLVSCHRQRVGKASTLAQARIVGAARDIAADPDLVGVGPALGGEPSRPPPRSPAVWPLRQRIPGGDLQRQPHDWIVRPLPMNLGE